MSSILGAFSSAFGGGSIGRASVDLVLNSTAYSAQLTEAEAKTKASTSSMQGGFSQALNDIKGNLGSIGLAAAGVGVAVVAGIGKAIGATLDWADQVRNLQRTTGQSAESASTFTAAAEKLGISVQAMQVGFGILEKNIINGSANLEKYGVATKDAAGATLPFDTVLANLADKFNSLPKGAEQTAFVMNAFGRSGRQLIPILQEGSAGFAALRVEAEKAGLVMSQADLDASLKLSISMRQLGDAFKGAEVQIGSLFVPIVASVVEGFTKMVEAAISLGKAVGSTLAPFFAQVGQAFGQLMQALQPLMPLLEQLGKLLGPLLVLSLVPLVAALKLLVGVFDFLATVVNKVVIVVNLFISALNLVIDASNAVIGTHFQHINALGQVQTATEGVTTATTDSVIAYDQANRAILGTETTLRRISDTLKGYEHDLVSTTKSTADGFLSLQTTVKDTFNVSLKEEKQGFSQMLQVALRFKSDMKQLENLKLGLDRHNMVEFEAFMAQQGPGFIDRFVNSSAQFQDRWVAKWQRSTGAVQSTISGLNDSLDKLNQQNTVIRINTAQIDAAAQKVHGLQSALARGL